MNKDYKIMTKTEIQFFDKIRCKFPYNDKGESMKIIDEASEISTEALFSVIEEICRIPYNERNTISNDVLIELLAKTEEK